MKPLPQSFYERTTRRVARDLLGCVLVREWRGKTLVGSITETEAYLGPKDKASHSSKGRTPRTEVMFGPAGRAYVYLIYGVYYCLNVVTAGEGEAVLIRGIEGANGPGRLCRAFHISAAQNRWDITRGGGLWIARGQRPRKIQMGLRIGVDYAGEWTNKPLRFFL